MQKKIDSRRSPKNLVFDRRKLIYLLKDIWILPLNPIYFILKHLFSHSAIFTFSSNIIFWHTYPLISSLTPFLFYKQHRTVVMIISGNFLLCITFFTMMSEMSRRIQKTKDMQIGLFGMILMSWCLILAIITKDSLDYWKVYFSFP